jgi:hypothetical protein
MVAAATKHVADATAAFTAAHAKYAAGGGGGGKKAEAGC